MIDMSFIESFIHTLFHQSGKATLSKQDILARVKQAPSATIQAMLPFFKQVPDTPYDESGLKDQMQDIIQNQSVETIMSKIRSRVKTG